MDPAPTPRRRPRVSLLSLLLLVAIGALSLAIWRQGQRADVYQRQINALRKEVGEVVVSDATKLTIQPLDGCIDIRRHFRWRVYVPSGSLAKFELTVASDQRPKAYRYASLWLEPGECGVELSALQHPSGDSWLWRLSQSNDLGGSVSASPPPWFGVPVQVTDLHDPAREPFEVSASEQVNLLHYAGVTAAGERVEVTLKASHFRPVGRPRASVKAGTKPLPASPPPR